jgi:hypothetical protein
MESVAQAFLPVLGSWAQAENACATGQMDAAIIAVAGGEGR